MKAQVLLPKVFNFPFTYNSKYESKIGDLVEVPFGTKNEIGVIWKNKYTEPKDIKIKNIHKKIGKISLNKNFINFMKWFAMYNVTPVGLVLKMVIGGNKNLFIKNDKNFHNELLDRIYDSLDDDSLPETYGAEDLYYISNGNLSLNPDQLYFHKSQIKNVEMLNKAGLARIYNDLCAVPSTDIQFNVNSLDALNAKVFLALFPDLNLSDIEKIILND